MSKSTFNPRIYFNHGYHDAARDVIDNRPRKLSESVHDIYHVSSAFNLYYFEGYKTGLAERNYQENSSDAWQAYRQTLSDEQLNEIYQAVVSSYIATWKPKDRNGYIMAEARKDAAKICGKEF